MEGPQEQQEQSQKVELVEQGPAYGRSGDAELASTHQQEEQSLRGEAGGSRKEHLGGQGPSLDAAAGPSGALQGLAADEVVEG